MTLTIELSPEEEARLNAAAAQRGLKLSEYVRRVVQEAAPRRLTARELMRLPREERLEILGRSVESAAPLYAADLALPAIERELTAFTILDGEPFLEFDGEDYA